MFNFDFSYFNFKEGQEIIEDLPTISDMITSVQSWILLNKRIHVRIVIRNSNLNDDLLRLEIAFRHVRNQLQPH